MQHTQDLHAAEEAQENRQNIWQGTPSYVERFREGRSSFEAEARQATHTFCGHCGFWVNGGHQCPPPIASGKTSKSQVQHAARRLTAFCQMCPKPGEVELALQELGFHLVFSLPGEARGEYTDLPPLPAQFHYEDTIGTCVEFLAGPDTPCLDDDEFAGLASPRYPAHASRFWLTSGGHELAMQRTQELLRKRWALEWLDQHAVELMEQAA